MQHEVPNFRVPPFPIEARLSRCPATMMMMMMVRVLRETARRSLVPVEEQTRALVDHVVPSSFVRRRFSRRLARASTSSSAGEEAHDDDDETRF